MNFVPCVVWVPRGKAASIPHKLQLSTEELKRLVDETKGLSNQDSDGETDEDQNSEKDSEQESVEECDKNAADDFDTRYNLDSYDNDDDENPVFKINDLAVHVDNHDDDYLTDEESEGDLEEKEDYKIKDSDNLLISGHVEDKSSVLEVHVYNQEEDDFYVHHDIVLENYPLALAWLDFHPADEKPGNYIAIGDMSSVMKIYDLDIVDVLEPDYTLGKMFDSEDSKNKKRSKKYHTDAVLSISWNKNLRNLLASGSADSSVIVWDLTEGKVLNKLSFHSNKVQALEWHPTESQFILSGCTDGFLKLYDCQSTDECKSWKVDGEVEKLVWNLNDSSKFFCSTDQGWIYMFDIRGEEIERQFQAHKEATTSLDISPLRPDVLISASMDRTLKVWDITKDCKMIKSLKLKVGSIYAGKVAPDLDLTVAVGGNNASNSLKVIDIFKSDKGTKSDEKDTVIENEEFVQKKNRVKNFNEQECKESEESEFQTSRKKRFKKSFDAEENEDRNFQGSSSIQVARKHKKRMETNWKNKLIYYYLFHFQLNVHTKAI